MYYFVVDETNKEPKQGSFFVVGGLVFTDAQTLAVDAAIEQIRTEFGYKPGDSLKFGTNERPSHVSIQAATEAKRRVVEALRANGVRMITYLILHDLCGGKSYDVKMNYALNTLVAAYAKMLREESGKGMLFIDRDNDRYAHLEHLFQHGLDFDRDVGVRDVVKFIGMSSDNASHISSATDIALGSFRYCVNTASGKGREEVARAMLGNLVDILWAKDFGRGPRAAGYGFHLRPQTVRAPTYQARYSSMVKSLGGFLVDVQEPPDPGDARVMP